MDTTPVKTVNVTLGGREIAVPAGGYFDRYRMNPNLDEVARDPAVSSLEFFRQHPKREAVARFGPTWTPNFYYRVSTIQLLLLAPLARLQAALPSPLQALRVMPRRGLVALNIYRYDVCDNDPYNEAAIAIVVRRPGCKASNAVEMLQSLRLKTNFAHVLALPVTTEIARVRGVEGYGLPKWMTGIELDIGNMVEGRVGNVDGTPDLVVRAPLPKMRPASQPPQVSTLKLVNTIDGAWHETLTQSHSLSSGQTLLPRGVQVVRGSGPMSTLLGQLEASIVIRLEVIREGQIALHLPEPITLGVDR